MSRKAARREFADLLKASLAGLVSKKSGSNEPAVYGGQVADFGKARAVAVVSSGGTETPHRIGTKSTASKHNLTVDIFVLYADRDAHWDEEDAEDLLDDISDAVLETIAEHPTGENWQGLDWLGTSRTDPVAIGGTEYRHEQIILKTS